MAPRPLARVASSAVALLLGARFALAFGENMWSGFMPEYLDALGASAFVIGGFAATQTLLEAAWQVPGGAMGDRFGERRALLALGVVALPGLLLFLLPFWPAVLLGLAFYTATSAIDQPLTASIVGARLPRGEHAQGFAGLSIAKTVTTMLAPPLAGYLIARRLGVLGGVRASVLAALALLLIALVVVAVFYPRSSQGRFRAMSFRLRDVPRSLRRLLLADALARSAQSLSKPFLVLYVVAVLGYDNFAFGLLLAASELVGLVLYWPVGWASDRTSRRPWIVATFAAFATFPLVVLAGASRWWVLAAGFVLLGLKEVGEPARKALVTELAEAGARGRTIGAYYALRSAFLASGGLAAGALWAVGGPRILFPVASAVGATGLLVFLASWGRIGEPRQ